MPRMESLRGKTAIVTGASSGFGQAITLALAKEGVRLGIGARRADRISEVAKKLQAETEVFAHPLDVRETASVTQFIKKAESALGSLDIVVNNAGLALGLDPIVNAKEEDWQQMMETNFLGIYRVSQAVLPKMIEQKSGHIVNIGSTAGHFAYEGGAGYCGSKFAVNAMTQSLRLETVEHGIRVTSVDPGLAETEFSVVRFSGDQERADRVYSGMTPLSAQDVAETVIFVLTRPHHVNIDRVIMTPLAQGGAHKVVREK